MESWDRKNAPPVTAKDSVTTRLESLIGRLDKLNHRLEMTVDRILGPTPRPADDTAQTTDCIRRGLDRAHELVSYCESQLDRLADGL